MRSFYTFGPDPHRQDLQTTEGYELAGFDFLSLKRANPLDSLPDNLCIFVSDNKPTSLLGNPFGWIIMSAEALAIVSKFVPDDDMQVFCPKIVNVKTGAQLFEYRIVQLVKLLPALAFRHDKGILLMNKIVIDAANVPEDIHAFRLPEAQQIWVVSEDLVKQLSVLAGIVSTRIKTS